LIQLRAHLAEAHGLSGRPAREALEAGRVRLRGVPTLDGGREVDPAEVELLAQGPRLRPGLDLVILHKDEHLAVLWKPAGLLAEPARSHADGHRSALGLAGRLLGRALLVHRLDLDTSGVMLVARTPEAQEGLKAALETHDVERRYLALVAGQLPAAGLRCELFLVRDRGDGRRGARPPELAPPDARAARTELRRVAPVGPRACLAEATLHTGRTHQVRLHCEALGHPVLGDTLYAPPGVARMAPRLALHAAILGFAHPITGERLRFDTPLPDDLERARRDLIRAAEGPEAPDDGGRPRGDRRSGRGAPPGRGEAGPGRRPQRGPEEGSRKGPPPRRGGGGRA
jgi:RluA family pseudouridine synthase